MSARDAVDGSCTGTAAAMDLGAVRAPAILVEDPAATIAA